FRSLQNKTVFNQQRLNNGYSSNFEKRFVVKTGNIIKIIDVNDIECFYSAFKSSFLSTVENRTFSLDDSLETIENEGNSEDFFRVSRQNLDNYKALKTISTYSNSRLKILLNHCKEEEIIVSPEKFQAFKK